MDQRCLGAGNFSTDEEQGTGGSRVVAVFKQVRQVALSTHKWWSVL